MKAASFDYLAAQDINQALAAQSSGDGAKIIAGGQSLGPMLNLRLVRPRLLIDISRIDELRKIETRGDDFWIGAATTHAQIEDRAEGMLQAVASGIAYRSIRNRGTIGGSMAHADPAADWPLALSTLGATLHIRGPNGARSVSATDFMIGAFTSVLNEQEIIETIQVPRPSAAARWGYYKFCRKTGEFPEASGAVFLDPDRRVANVFVGALNSAPQRCAEIARKLAQRETVDMTACESTLASVAGLDGVSLRMHAATLMRAISQALLP